MKILDIQGRLQNLIGRINLPFFRNLSKSEREYLIKIFADEKSSKIKPELKLRMYEILIQLMKRHRESFGFLLVLGWNSKWNKEFMSLPDVSQNIFEETLFRFMEHSMEEGVNKLSRTIDFDGAVLVNSNGRAFASGVYLENMKPKQVIEKTGISRYEDLSQAFGFSHKVHTRHLSGIAASYWLKNTLVYVISEEDQTLRVFEKGRIIYSPYKKEIAWNKE
ncbi:MAG: hypothetical protein UX65_C0016G0007 [Parcubacteria group bacterium GW2011_GWB1_46_8]|nr:MAG: hypothetical protein UX14_C0013G0008 [Parcubacteria group bacterium GW2011_GWF1_45_5]KKU11354.1 MAG: hypothetical protein UX15_C0008G0005 [Parcubacteria group bacterium GW2011_GWA1_45_7]KKU45890.1 MAG: hypothetical protein UX65_C0016G0007 [Parcubacteria group bacterium GW2011_GWB1_46_8]KKU47554.1 MAG: hypothetical protein UX66_C0010G0008 [Parcubacteria group bacterium GW2011_GWF2_46_8]